MMFMTDYAFSSWAFLLDAYSANNHVIRAISIALFLAKVIDDTLIPNQVINAVLFDELLVSFGQGHQILLDPLVFQSPRNRLSLSRVPNQ
jgi:hypothetical protein